MTGISSSSQANPVLYKRKDYIQLAMSANQTTGISAGDPVKFDTLVIGNMSFSPATYRVTLKAGRTYALKMAHWANFNDATSYLYCQFYNVTAGAYITNNTSGQYPETYASANYAGNSVVFSFVTVTVDSLVECRISAVSDLYAIYKDTTFMEITEIENFAPQSIENYTITSRSASPAVTGTYWTNSWVTVVPYKTAEGIWRAYGNISGAAAGNPANLTLSVAGLTFRTSYPQGITAVEITNAATNIVAYANNDPDDLVLACGGAGFKDVRISFNVELKEKPTWI